MAFVPTTPSETKEWLVRYHAVNDAMNSTKLSTIYTKDVRLQFGNNPIIQGLDAVKAHFELMWPGFERMRHDIEEFDLVGTDKIYQSCRINLQVKNDPENEQFTVPGMAVFHLETSGEAKGLVKQAEYYLDVSPTFAAFARAG